MSASPTEPTSTCAVYVPQQDLAVATSTTTLISTVAYPTLCMMSARARLVKSSWTYCTVRVIPACAVRTSSSPVTYSLAPDVCQGKARGEQLDLLQCEGDTCLCCAHKQLTCDVLHLSMVPSGTGLGDVGQDASCLVHHLCILQRNAWCWSGG